MVSSVAESPETSTPAQPAPLKGLLGTIARLGTPSVLENLLNTAVVLIDTLMLARLPNNEVFLAATGLTGLVLWRLSGVAGATQVGTGAYVARRWGEENHDAACRAASHGILLGGVAGLIALAIFAPLAHHIFVWLGGETPVVTASASYFLIVMFGIPLRLSLLNLTASLRAAGDTRTPMALMALMVVANIALNWILIFGNLGAPALGMDGAAIATSASFAVGWLVGVWRLRRGLRPRRLMPAASGLPLALTADAELEGEGIQVIPPPPSGTMRFDRAGMRPWLPEATPTILRVSLPAFLEEILVSIGFLTFMGMVARFGTEVLAAHASAVRIEAMSFTAGWGVAVAAATMVGQALGARQVPLARRLLSLNLVVSMAIMGTLGILFCLMPGWLLGWFRLSPQIESIAIALMFIIAIQQPFIGSTMVLGGGLRGAGDTIPPFITQLVGTIAVRIGVGYWLAWPMGMGIYGVYWATFFDWLARTIVLAIFVKSGKWERVKV